MYSWIIQMEKFQFHNRIPLTESMANEISVESEQLSKSDKINFTPFQGTKTGRVLTTEAARMRDSARSVCFCQSTEH